MTVITTTHPERAFPPMKGHGGEALHVTPDEKGREWKAVEGGGGGARPLPVFSDSSLAFTFGTDFVQVDGHSLEITTTGRPVLLALVPDNNEDTFEALVSMNFGAGTGAYSLKLFFMLGVGSPPPTYLTAFRNAQNYNASGPQNFGAVPPGAYQTVWTPAAGTYRVSTWVLCTAPGGSTPTGFVHNCRLMAWEM